MLGVHAHNISTIFNHKDEEARAIGDSDQEFENPWTKLPMTNDAFHPSTFIL
jgi:hypothetical protein